MAKLGGAVRQVKKRSVAKSPDGRARLREKPQRIADELRRLIVSGKLSDGESLGHEPDLVERFGVSRPSLREALRILEAEGLISVVRGMLGGIVVHKPNERMTARTAALVLQARNVSLADVYEARSLLEPLAVRVIASSRSRRAAVKELRQLTKDETRVIMDPRSSVRVRQSFGGTAWAGLMTGSCSGVVTSCPPP